MGSSYTSLNELLVFNLAAVVFAIAFFTRQKKHSARFSFNLAMLGVVVLPGCASMNNDNNQQAVANIEMKYEKLIESQPILYLLENKIVLSNQENPTLDNVTDRSFANDSQKEAIAAFDRIVTETNVALMEITRKREATGEASLFNDWMKASKDNRLALYQDQVSFGVYNQNCKTLNEVMRSLSNQFSKAAADKAHQAWSQALPNWRASLEENQPVTAANPATH